MERVRAFARAPLSVDCGAFLPFTTGVPAMNAPDKFAHLLARTREAFPASS